MHPDYGLRRFFGRHNGTLSLVAILTFFSGQLLLCQVGLAAQSLAYPAFIEAIESNHVRSISIKTDTGTAMVVMKNGRQGVVNLSPDKDLLSLLDKHNVEINVQPTREPSALTSTPLGAMILGFLAIVVLGIALVRRNGRRFSLSGMICTGLGLYLVGTGLYNVSRIVIDGSRGLQSVSELLPAYGLTSENAPIAIVVTYVIGAPIFLGAGLMALGSLARRRD